MRPSYEGGDVSPVGPGRFVPNAAPVQTGVVRLSDTTPPQVAEGKASPEHNPKPECPRAETTTQPPVAERISMRRDAMTSYPVPRDNDDCRAVWCDGRCDVSVGGIIIMLLTT